MIEGPIPYETNIYLDAIASTILLSKYCMKETVVGNINIYIDTMDEEVIKYFDIIIPYNFLRESKTRRKYFISEDSKLNMHPYFYTITISAISDTSSYILHETLDQCCIYILHSEGRKRFIEDHVDLNMELALLDTTKFDTYLKDIIKCTELFYLELLSLN